MTAKEGYQLYLETDHWRRLREAVLYRDGYKCVHCLATGNLQVHHKFYRKRWEDSIVDDLVTLCELCHHKEHAIRSNRRRRPRMHRRSNLINSRWT